MGGILQRLSNFQGAKSPWMLVEMLIPGSTFRDSDNTDLQQELWGGGGGGGEKLATFQEDSDAEGDYSILE